MQTRINELLRNQNKDLAECVSVIIPLYRTQPDRKLNALLIREGVEKARNIIIENAKPEHLDYLITALEDLVDEIDPRINADGVGIFISPEIRKMIYFPFPVRASETINSVFDIRDLVYVNERWFKYWVISLDRGRTCLYKGEGTKLNEIIDKNFPETYEQVYQYPDSKSMFYLDEESKINKERHLQYMRHLAKRVAPYLNDNGYPVILTGVEENLLEFKSTSGLEDRLIGEIQGSFEKVPSSKLVREVWNAIEEYLEHRNRQIITELPELRGKRGYETGLMNVWRIVRDGNGDLLLVERNFEVEAYTDHLRRNLYLSKGEAPKKHTLINAVNSLIESIVENSGQVIFFQDGELDNFGHIAVRRRY